MHCPGPVVRHTAHDQRVFEYVRAFAETLALLQQVWRGRSDSAGVAWHVAQQVWPYRDGLAGDALQVWVSRYVLAGMQ